MLIKTDAVPPAFSRGLSRTNLRKDQVARFGMMPEPAYRPLGYHVTCIPDAVYPWPLWQVKLIRRTYDPGFLPLFRRMVYRTPAGGVLTFVHHGVGRHGRESMDGGIISAPTPSWWPFERATFVERWFEHAFLKPGSVRAKNNLPRAFVPWGDWVQRWAEETYWAASAAEKTHYVDTHGEHVRTASQREFEAAEAAYRQKEDLSYQRRQYEQLEDRDAVYVQELAAGRVPHEKKPFVEIGEAK